MHYAGLGPLERIATRLATWFTPRLGRELSQTPEIGDGRKSDEQLHELPRRIVEENVESQSTIPKNPYTHPGYSAHYRCRLVTEGPDYVYEEIISKTR